MQPFDITGRMRVVFGQGSIRRLGELAADLGARTVMIVSDAGLIEAGHFDVAKASLQQHGIHVESFHDFSDNPTSDMVDAGVRRAGEVNPDLLVGLGGGSSMDCCKGINFVYCCGGTIHDYQGVGKATTDLLPMIAIPTTAGTGSEAQSFALISDAKTHVKMPCGDARAACRTAILDPDLTLTQPTGVSSLTGIDALSHAIETYVTEKRNPMSVTYSKRAFELLSSGFSKVLREPQNLTARSQMQLGAHFAGMAIETSMLGAAHAVANPLTARFNIIHGQAVGMMLPAVIRMNASTVGHLYAELLQAAGVSASAENAADRLACRVTDWLIEASLATKLRDLSIPANQFDVLTDDALTQWTGTFNPVSLSHDNVMRLYQASF